MNDKFASWPHRVLAVVTGALRAITHLMLNIPERPMRWAQRVLGGQRIAWLFLTPNLIIFSLFTFLPILINFYYAVTGGVQLWPSERPFIGTENFQKLFACDNYFDYSTCDQDLFWRAIYNSMKFVSIQVVLMVLFSLITALVLNRKIVGRGFFRSVYFFPVLLSPVVVALVWRWILLRDGVLNAIIESMGGEKVLWLLDPSWSFFWVIFVTVWAQMGFYTLILLAGLQAIPRDVYEAAQMDRASPWRTFRKITLPLLMPNMIVVLALALIRAVQTFDEVFVLTGGGPGSATTFLVQYIYNTGFAQQIQRFGLAAAASLVLAVVLFILTMAQLRASRSKIDG